MSVIVVCPKCAKRQQVDAAVPPDGLRYSCAFCQAPFMVKLPRSPAPPAPAPQPSAQPPRPATAAPKLPSMPPLPFDLDGGIDLPAAAPPHRDLPAARGGEPAFDFDAPPPPSQGRKSRPFAMDLPVSTNDMPLPDDFLAPRDEVPRPGDLPMPRESMPLPDDFLAPREQVPRPGDLPAPRESIPLPGDFLAPREQVPRPGDLPAPRESMPLPGDFLASRDAVPRPDDFLASRESMPLPGDFLASRDAVPRPGDFLASRDAVPRPGDLPATRDELSLPRNLPSAVGQIGARGNLPASRSGEPPPPRVPTLRGPDQLEQPAELGFDPFASDFQQSASSPLAPLDLGREDAAGPPTLTPAGALDDERGYGLQLEGGSPGTESSEDGPRPVRFNLPTGGQGDEGLEPLAPVTPRRGGVAELPEPVASPGRRRAVILGAAAVVVLGGAAAAVLFTLRKAEPKPEQVLSAFAADLIRDAYPGYQRAADRLLEVSGLQPQAVGLRAAAAEELLLAFVAHNGERTKLSQADQLVTAVPAQTEPFPALCRARALLSVAKGKGDEAAGLLGAEGSTIEGALVLGLRDLSAGKPAAAAAILRRFVAGRPDRVLGHFLLGRALEESSPAEAVKEYRAAVAANPTHFGAALGLARLTEDRAERLAALQRVVESRSGAPRGELADGFVTLGRTAQDVGRSSDAVAAFNKALTVDPINAAANVAIGEALMLEGRYVDALRKFQAAGPAGLRIPAGRFGMGGALMATGLTDQGKAQIQQAAQENPKDPRGLYYTGFTAEIGQPPDLEAAAQDYRAALKLDRAFLPASLRLAALMERQGRPDDALAVLKQAQEAGAPASALQIAWGEALVVAKQPARAEEVFRKAISETPKDAPPHLGLAAALDAQGKTEEARNELEKAVEAVPQSLALRDRLAVIETKLGHKDEAISHYKAEIATGSAPPAARVALAKLALEVGRLDEAKVELDKVTDESPGTPDALFTLARLWEARHDLPKALQEYRRALRFDNTPYVQLAFARALIRLGRETEAMTALDASTAIPDGLIERGKLLYRRGEYDRALADFEAAAKQAPRDPQAPLWAGMSHDKMGEADQAAESWRGALRLTPDDPETHYRIGRFELDKGHIGKAVEHLRRSAGRVPEQADWKAELYFQLGTAEATSGARGPAVAAFRTYLELAPADAAARPEAVKQIRRMSGGR